MNKTELINKFLEKADLKPHELVYWKHKVSNGFDLIKFMSDFLDYAESEQLLIQRVVVPKGTLCKHTDKHDNDIRTYVAEINRWYCSNCDELA